MLLSKKFCFLFADSPRLKSAQNSLVEIKLGTYRQKAQTIPHCNKSYNYIKTIPAVKYYYMWACFVLWWVIVSWSMRAFWALTPDS